MVVNQSENTIFSRLLCGLQKSFHKEKKMKRFGIVCMMFLLLGPKVSYAQQIDTSAQEQVLYVHKFFLPLVSKHEYFSLALGEGGYFLEEGCSSWNWFQCAVLFWSFDEEECPVFIGVDHVGSTYGAEPASWSTLENEGSQVYIVDKGRAPNPWFNPELGRIYIKVNSTHALVYLLTQGSAKYYQMHAWCSET